MDYYSPSSKKINLSSSYYECSLFCSVVKATVTVVVIILRTHLSTAYPGGAPDLACSTMFPSGHSSDAQTTLPPYKIRIRKTTYNPGETISVDIFGDKSYFTGLYVQVRKVGCQVNTTQPIGAFTANDGRLQTRHCSGIIHSTVTQTSSVRKDFVSVYWTAPVVPLGHLVVRATVVKDRSTFWVGVESSPLVDLQSTGALICESHENKLIIPSTKNNSKVTKNLSDFNVLNSGKNQTLYQSKLPRRKYENSCARLSLSSSSLACLAILVIKYVFYNIVCCNK